MAAGLRYNWQDSLVVTSRLKDATWHDHLTTCPAATAATTIPFDDSWHLSVVEHVIMPTRWWSADSYVLPKIQLRPTLRWPFWLWLSRRIVALRRTSSPRENDVTIWKSTKIFFFIFLSTFQFLDNLLTFWNDGSITPPWSLLALIHASYFTVG